MIKTLLAVLFLYILGIFLLLPRLDEKEQTNETLPKTEEKAFYNGVKKEVTKKKD